MKKIPLTRILDFCFYGFCLFILSLVFTSYFLRYPYSLILSFCLAVLCSLIIFPIINGKYKRKICSKKEQKAIESLSEYLSLSKKTTIFSLFYNALKAKGYTVERKKGGFYICEKNTYLFLCFDFEPLKKSEIVKIFNLLNKNEKALIFTNVLTTETKSFALRFDNRIIAIGIEGVYDFLKETSSLPSFPEVQKKNKLKRLFTGLFTKKRATKFFLLGLTFLFLSLFSYVKIYYIIFGTVLMVLSIVSKSFGIAEIDTIPEIL